MRESRSHQALGRFGSGPQWLVAEAGEWSSGHAAAGHSAAEGALRGAGGLLFWYGLHSCALAPHPIPACLASHLRGCQEK